MKKIRLDPEDVRVNSFATLDSSANAAPASDTLLICVTILTSGIPITIQLSKMDAC